MKTTLLKYTLILAIFGFFAACGGDKKEGGEGEGQDTTATEGGEEQANEGKPCPEVTTLKLTAAGVENQQFEPKTVWVQKKTENFIRINALNYERDENYTNRWQDMEPGQIRLEMLMRNDFGDLEPGEYIYNDHPEDKERKMVVTVYTSEGKSILYAGMGDENKATVELYKLTDDMICGRLEGGVEGTDTRPKFNFDGEFRFEFNYER